MERNYISSGTSSLPETGLKTVRFFRSYVVSEVLIENNWWGYTTQKVAFVPCIYTKCITISSYAAAKEI